MMVNVQQYEYVPYLSQSSGARIVLHDNNAIPFPEEQGVSVSPNTNIDITLLRVCTQSSSVSLPLSLPRHLPSVSLSFSRHLLFVSLPLSLPLPRRLLLISLPPFSLPSVAIRHHAILPLQICRRNTQDLTTGMVSV